MENADTPGGEPPLDLDAGDHRDLRDRQPHHRPDQALTARGAAVRVVTRRPGIGEPSRVTGL